VEIRSKSSALAATIQAIGTLRDDSGRRSVDRAAY
jgi:hypothetical protein